MEQRRTLDELASNSRRIRLNVSSHPLNALLHAASASRPKIALAAGDGPVLSASVSLPEVLATMAWIAFL